MKYYASHYLWHAGQNRLFRMQRIGIDESLGFCVSMEPLNEEMRQTVWLGGLIVLAASSPEIRFGESFQDFCLRVSGVELRDTPLKAFHVPAFDAVSMVFTGRSRVASL